ncbi:MAG TPA: hypothetical protein VN364_04835 [Bellilinea sp.]|nr:hypothetical protein [Bellilinea sp.]
MKFIKTRDWLWLGLVLLIAVLGFLPQVGSLGYYHDDWFPTISRVSGVDLWDMHLVDRPTLGRWYGIINNRLGESPLAWHLFAFAARFAGAFFLYWLSRLIWPGQRMAAALIALIYAVYPGFLQQPSANNFQAIIFDYAASILSITLSILAIKAKRLWLNILLTLAAAGMVYFYLSIYEALIGMEGFRFLLIWLVYRQESTGRWLKTTGKAILQFVPYLLVAGYFLYWRLFIFNSVRVAMNSDALLAQLTANPGGTALQVLITVVTDLVDTILGAWVIPGYQLGLKTSVFTSILAILLALAAAAILIIVIKRINRQPEANSGEVRGNWARQAIWLGLLGVILTLIPIALTGRDVQFQMYLDRYTYQSIAPAAFLITGLIFSGVKPAWRPYVSAVLIFLAVFTHSLNASAYAQNWNLQKQVWWQLSWRAPGLVEGTTLVVHMPPGYRYPEDFEIWAPASRIYYPGPGPLKITAEVLNAETLPAMLAREITGRDYRGVVYQRDFNQAVIISMPTEKSCLHVQDGAKPELSPADDPLLVQAAGISRLDRIDTASTSPTPPKIIFGSEPEHGWCYTYQQASLARQQNNWDAVAQLGDEGFGAGQVPVDLVEYAPFLEAYLHLNRLQDTENLAARIIAGEPKTAQLLCKNYQAATTASDMEIAQPAISILCQK